MENVVSPDGDHAEQTDGHQEVTPFVLQRRGFSRRPVVGLRLFLLRVVARRFACLFGIWYCVFLAVKRLVVFGVVQRFVFVIHLLPPLRQNQSLRPGKSVR